MPLSGNLVNNARYPTVELSAPLDATHAAGAAPDDADIFGGSAPAGPGPDYGSPGMWVAPETGTPHTGVHPDAQTHWSTTAPVLTPPRLGWVDAAYVARDQMMKSHSARDSSTSVAIPHESQFLSAGQGNIVNRQQGQMSWEPGLSGPLARGSNSYAENNPSTVVYDGDGWRRGYDTLTWGQYRSPTKQMMEYTLRALGQQDVHFPVDTPALVGQGPGGGFGSGTQIAQSPYGSVPRLYTPPNTSAISDLTMAAQGLADSGFSSDGWA
jgi:hypothetical protein